MPKRGIGEAKPFENCLKLTFRDPHLDANEVLAAARDAISRGQIDGPVKLQILVYARDDHELADLQSVPYYTELVIDALSEFHGLVETDIEELMVVRKVGITRGARIQLMASGFEVRR